MNDALDALNALNPSMEREKWIRAAFGFKDAGGTEDEWLKWCEGGANFNRADAISTWRNAKPRAGGVTAASLFMMARDAGYKPENGSRGVAPMVRSVAKEKAPEPPPTDPVPVWDACQAVAGHAYLTRKAIKPHGARMSTAGWLVVPYFNRERQLQTVQFIAADGTKRFLAGAKAKGSVAIMGEPTNAEVVVVAEGFATAAAIEEATGYPTLAAGSRVSLPEAARIARHFAPRARVVIAADRGDMATPIAAARGVGGVLAVPGPEDSPDGFDFADWRIAEKNDAAILSRINNATPVPSENTATTPTTPKTSASKVVAFPTGDDGEVEPGPYLLDGKRRVIANVANVAAFLASGAVGELRRDSFTGVVTWRGAPFGEFTYTEIQIEVQRALLGGRRPFVKIATAPVIDAYNQVAEQNSYNSNVEWLDGLAPWDETPRIDTFFSDVTGTDATPYSLGVSRYFWLGLVARMVKPGTKVDAAVALVGPQGVGKSSLARIIGGERHGEVGLAMIGERDWCAQLRGKIIVEMAELSGHSRAELESIKAILTRTHDEYRSAYARTAASVPRGCVFMATTNEEMFLIDSGGNRRWLPITCPNPLNLDMVHAMREQLFAEAYVYVKAGLSPTWYVVPDSASVQESHVARDPWVDALDEKLRDLSGRLPDRIANTAIFELLKVPADKQRGGADSRRIAAIMKALGFTRGKWMSGDGGTRRQIRGYVRLDSSQLSEDSSAF